VLRDSPGRKSLLFNYRTKYNDMWDSAGLRGLHDYSVQYGDEVRGISLNLL
jgi:hypothetical protein